MCVFVPWVFISAWATTVWADPSAEGERRLQGSVREAPQHQPWSRWRCSSNTHRQPSLPTTWLLPLSSAQEDDQPKWSISCRVIRLSEEYSICVGRVSVREKRQALADSVWGCTTAKISLWVTDFCLKGCHSGLGRFMDLDFLHCECTALQRRAPQCSIWQM